MVSGPVQVGERPSGTPTRPAMRRSVKAFPGGETAAPAHRGSGTPLRLAQFLNH